MKNKRSWLFITLVVTFALMSLQIYQPVNNVSGQTTGDLRINRLILNSTTITYNQNDTLFIYMSLENIVNETLYDITFNITAKEDLYEIDSSSNMSQSSKEFVSFSKDKLEFSEIFTFNITLRVLSNESDIVKFIDSFRIDYKVGEFKLPTFVEAPELEIFLINSVVDEKELKPKIFGFQESDLMFFLFFFISPVVLGFLLSFLFGRRQNK
ncbi:MAG: hypothetical protein ACC656_06585 [Candidatus Heimdallarchaeota archaeon]